MQLMIWKGPSLTAGCGPGVEDLGGFSPSQLCFFHTSKWDIFFHTTQAAFEKTHRKVVQKLGVELYIIGMMIFLNDISMVSYLWSPSHKSTRMDHG